MILAPCALLGVAAKVDARNVVMMASLGAAHPGEEAFGLIGAGAGFAIGQRMVDDLHSVAAGQFIPGGAFVHHDLSLTGNPVADEGQGRAF